ncbi:MAG: glycosyltransferase, partial [Candidatus Neomarinimicrobiota bacterium]
MALLNLLLIVFQGCLAVYLLTLAWFMLGLFRREPRRSPRQPPVSVIVAVRGGHPNFHLLLEQLQAQDYPADQLECIIVDDGLDASSRALVDDVAARRDNFQVVASSRGDTQLVDKKRALDGGVRASAGELLLFTDADCQVGPGWVSGLVSYFLNGVEYVVGWSQVAASASEGWAAEITAARRPLTLFEQIDFALLMLATRGATLMGTPWACSGQNQAYRRTLYDAVGGFRNLAGQVQGDDSLFLQLARRKARARVAFATDHDTRVVTAPAP